MSSTIQQLILPLRLYNPITVQVLGICSALAVTTSLQNALIMSAALSAVLCASSIVISTMRNHIPNSTRLIIQITIIASLVIVVDLVLKAYLFEISQKLSVFVSLIVTNCLVLGRAEAVFMKQPIKASLIDAIGNSMGYSLILLLVAAIRELLGSGSLFGVVVMPFASEGGWFVPLDFMLSAPSAFFIIGLLVWLFKPRATKHPIVETTVQSHLVIKRSPQT